MPDLLIYNFSERGTVSLLETQTSIWGTVGLFANHLQERILWLSYAPDDDGDTEILHKPARSNQIVLLLRPAVLDGSPGELRLEVEAKKGRCRITLEAQDLGGRVVRLPFGEVHDGEHGIRSCALPPQLFSSAPGAQGATAIGPPRLPLQFARLFIELCDASRPLELGLARLFATGRARLAAAGIAAGS